MKHLHIEPTRSTLAVDFNPDQGTLVMRGESYPENALNFFTPVLAWLEKYLDSGLPASGLTLDMDIVYFNSSSSKAFMNLFDLLESAAGSGLRISINWRYHEENEVACECGEEFAEDLRNVDFRLEPYGDEDPA